MAKDEGWHGFQSTRPQGARRAAEGPWREWLVSIHAPARGATAVAIQWIEEKWFQSTRPQGARQLTAEGSALAKGFNPRARKGRDRITRPGKSADTSFNPRARKGRDDVTKYTAAPAWFQSTRPQGARPFWITLLVTLASFNPRARKGRDRRQLPRRRYSKVSIHAPARGATWR